MVQLLRAQEEVSRAKKVNAVHIVFDGTTTASETMGAAPLLTEMSYAEMRERGSIQESKEKKKTDERRAKIISKKLDKEKELHDRASKLEQIRKQSKTEAADRKATDRKKRADKAAVEKEAQDSMWLDLHTRIQDKKKSAKEEQERIAEEAKAAEIKRQFLNADASKVEEIKWMELEKGAEREAKIRQKEYQVTAIKSEAIKEQEAIQKAKNVTAAQKAKVKKIRAYDADVHKAEGKTNKEKALKEASKVAKAKIQHQLEANQRQRTKDAYPQVNNFSEVVYKDNMDKEAKKRTRKARQQAPTMQIFRKDGTTMNLEGAGAGSTGAAALEVTKMREGDEAGGDALGETMAGDEEHDLMHTSDLDKFKAMALGYDSEQGDEGAAPL